MPSQRRQEERGRIPNREGGAGAHCGPSGGNSRCKGPGVRKREREWISPKMRSV